MEHNHVFSLEAKHALLDQQIHQERPNPDQIMISRLKKQKLKIKEELAQA